MPTQRERELSVVLISTTPAPARESHIGVRARTSVGEQNVLVATESSLNKTGLLDLLGCVKTSHAVIIADSHSASPSYFAKFKREVAKNEAPVLVPQKFNAAIPASAEKTAQASRPVYLGDASLYGVVFDVERMCEFLENHPELDFNFLFLAYHLTVKPGNVVPTMVGYSINSVTQLTNGLTISEGVTTLLPDVKSNEPRPRLHALNLMTAFLRGLRTNHATPISLRETRQIVRNFDLKGVASHLRNQNPIEELFIWWLADPNERPRPLKLLSNADTYISFGEVPSDAIESVFLFEAQFSDETIPVHKVYRPRTAREEYGTPEDYSFHDRPITTDSVILFFDRAEQADDNAEHLYRHFIKNYPEYDRAYFAIKESSSDWERLKNEGFKLVDFHSDKFWQLFLESDLIVSSQIYSLSRHGKSLSNSRSVYLQHGIQLNDMTEWMTGKMFDVFVGTGENETSYLRKTMPIEALNSGIPRLQTLQQRSDEKTSFLFMPTWRFNLKAMSNDEFKESDFFQRINALFTDERLLEYLRRTNSLLRVKLHPSSRDKAHLFAFSDVVIDSDLTYQDDIAQSKFVFTDYSSAVLDAAFIHTPIAYYQWDIEDFFNDQVYSPRVDLEKDGLGPVFYEHDPVIDYIVKESFLNPDHIYDSRRDAFFAGVDAERINDRIIERMLCL